MKYDYLIVGAGLYGAVFAHEMTTRGRRVCVIDRRGHIGGNVYTRKVRGIHVHEYGAHIFHTSDKEVWDYVRSFASFNHFVNAPVALYGDRLYNLPFNMNTFVQMWGIRTPQEAQQIIAAQRKEAAKEILAMRGQKDAGKEEEIIPRNLEEQGLLLAGRDIFDRLIRGYTEKQWGRDCKELPAFIIRRLPFRFIFDNNYFNDPFQGIPEDGYTALCERLLEGADVILHTPFGKDVPQHERLVFTGRIDEFFDFQYGALEYRSLRFETQDLPDTDNYQGNAVINYTERKVPYTRIIEHKHFNFGRGQGTVITREYPDDYAEGKEPYYPVNDERNNALYEQYAQLAGERSPAVIFGGRLGRYRYYNMDEVIRTALDDARAAE